MSSQLYPKNLGTRFAQHLENLFPRNEVEIVARGSEYSQYQDDPVGFGEKILGETYTDEVKIMMESVRDNPMVAALGYAVHTLVTFKPWERGTGGPVRLFPTSFEDYAQREAIQTREYLRKTNLYPTIMEDDR